MMERLSKFTGNKKLLLEDNRMSIKKRSTMVLNYLFHQYLARKCTKSSICLTMFLALSFIICGKQSLKSFMKTAEKRDQNCVILSYSPASEVF